LRNIGQIRALLNLGKLHHLELLFLETLCSLNVFLIWINEAQKLSFFGFNDWTANGIHTRTMLLLGMVRKWLIFLFSGGGFSVFGLNQFGRTSTTIPAAF